MSIQSKVWRTAIVLVALTMSTTASAAVLLSFGVSASDSNVPLQTSESVSGKGSIAFGFSSYFRIGFTHRQQIQSSERWTETYDPVNETSEMTKSSNMAHVTANSVNLTLLLYRGRVLTPYLIGGVVKKTYNYENTRQLEGHLVTTRTKVTSKPVQNLGGGLAIKLRENLSLKLSYIASPGYTQEPDGEVVGVWDKNASVELGIEL